MKAGARLGVIASLILFAMMLLFMARWLGGRADLLEVDESDPGALETAPPPTLGHLAALAIPEQVLGGNRSESFLLENPMRRVTYARLDLAQGPGGECDPSLLANLIAIPGSMVRQDTGDAAVRNDVLPPEAEWFSRFLGLESPVTKVTLPDGTYCYFRFDEGECLMYLVVSDS